MIDKDLLSILSCPETKKDLELADEETVAKINTGIQAGNVRNKACDKITETIDGGLFRVGDKTCIYPIRENIPILLIDELIVLEGILD